MPIRAPHVNKLPGEPGFVDEFNAAIAELTKVANKVLKVDVQRITSSGTKSFAHSLGVKPTFVWAFYDSDDTSFLQTGAEVTAADEAAWDARRVRFTSDGVTHYVFIFSTE